MTRTSPVPTQPKKRQPNQQALNEFLDRYLLWLAKQELQKRSKRLRGRNRAASIKI
jgi:hypothetical protein